MHDGHLIEALQIDLDFENLPLADADAPSFQSQLADTLRGPALRQIDRQFDAASAHDEVWRIDRLEIDLGRIVIDAGQDWPSRWMQALRDQLQRLLRELRDAPFDEAAEPTARRPLARHAARLEMLMYFLRHGHLPWYGRGRRSEDPRELGRELLRHDARGLAAALRAAGDRPALLQRLAGQFDGIWLAELVHALLPDEPLTVARLLETVVRASRPGRADSALTVARLWEAALGQALAQGSSGRVAELAVMRLQLQWALETDPRRAAEDDPLTNVAPAWQRLLRDDRAWLKSSLQRIGASQALEQRLARALSTELLSEVAGLWLAREQTVAVSGWISAVAARSAASPLAAPEQRRHLWQAALGHLWAGGGGAAFDGRRFARELRERIGRHGDAAQAGGHAREGDAWDRDLEALWADDGLDRSAGAPVVDTVKAVPLLALPAELLRPDAVWHALRSNPAALQHAVQKALAHGEATSLRLAEIWSDELLLAVTSLRWPEARPWIAAVVSSPPHDAATLARRWACTLRQAFQAGAAFDEAAYLDAWVHEDLLHTGHSVEEGARQWKAAIQDAAATPNWLERIVKLTTLSPAVPVAPISSEAAVTTLTHSVRSKREPAAIDPASTPFPITASSVTGAAGVNGIASDKGSPTPACEPGFEREAPPPLGAINPFTANPVPAAGDALHHAEPHQERPEDDLAKPLPSPNAALPLAPESLALARSLAGKVVQRLATLASTLGQRLGRLFSPGVSPAAATREAATPDAQPALPVTVSVDNAGLVLIGPYLPRLFEALGLANDNAFVNEPARERALHLMQFAVDGRHEPAPESRLMLNKLLCGIEPETPIGRRFSATPEECTLIESLLGAVIAHWRVLGQTSIAGLRETFLQRPGQLSQRADGAWSLAVQPAAFDMLIDRLPWGYAMQKHPWMSEVLHVDWR